MKDAERKREPERIFDFAYGIATTSLPLALALASRSGASRATFAVLFLLLTAAAVSGVVHDLREIARGRHIKEE